MMPTLHIVALIVILAFCLVVIAALLVEPSQVSKVLTDALSGIAALLGGRA